METAAVMPKTLICGEHGVMAPERNITCSEHAHTLERIRGMETTIAGIESDNKVILEKLDGLTDLLHARPTWIVCVIISFLMTLCGILITIIETAEHVTK